MTAARVTILGAGIAGIAAAVRLLDRGCEVRVLEKRSRIGGRMATFRPAGEGLDGAVFDHGAQFFTTRGSEFTSLIEAAVEAGAVRAWTHGFDDPPDGFPRWCGTTAMTDLVEWMATAAGIAVELGTEVTDLRSDSADAYLLTAPIPQTLSVLSFSGLLPSPSIHARLAAVAYKPTISVLLRLDRSPGGFPEHGGVQYLDHADLAFVTDNERKGISHRPAVTVHLSNELSVELWDATDADVAGRAVELISGHLHNAGVLDTPGGVEVRRWRYAGPFEVLAERTIVWGDQPIVAVAGEAFGGPKVEGAFMSGIAAADALDSALA